MYMNHFNDMMSDVYNLLTKRKVQWPSDMTFDQKIVLHEKEIEYWRERGDYEKCFSLQKKLSKLYKDHKNNK